MSGAITPLSRGKRIWVFILSSFVGPAIAWLLMVVLLGMFMEELKFIDPWSFFLAIAVLSSIFSVPAGFLGGLLLLSFRFLLRHHGGLNWIWVVLAGGVSGFCAGLAISSDITDYPVLLSLSIVGVICGLTLWFLRRFLGLGDL